MTTHEFRQSSVAFTEEWQEGEPYIQALSLVIKPPFYPGEGLGKAVDLAGCSVELVGANDDVSHLRLERTDALHDRNITELITGAKNIKSYVRKLGKFTI